MKRARIYVRLSQRGEKSIAAQIRDCKEYVEGHSELEFDELYNEGQYSSGWDSAREKYQQMLEDARAGEFDALVVRDASRLGRDKKERFRQFLNLDAWGVEFHTRKRGYVDPDAPQDFLMEAFYSMSDDDGKGAETERLSEAIRKKVKNGHYHGAPKYGTKYSDDKTALVAGEEFDIAIEVLNRRYGRGDYEKHSYREIRDATGCDLARIKRILDNEHVYRTIEANARWGPGDAGLA